MQALDQHILQFFVEHRTVWFSFLMIVVTYFGNHLIVLGITLLSTASFLIHHHSKKSLALLLSVVGSSLTVFILKNIFNRSRPESVALYLEGSPSFPSWHANIAIALYGFLLYAIWQHEKHPLKNPLLLFLAILIPLIGLSRLYLGVHYFSDVLVGYIIGLVWFLIARQISKSKI